MKTFKVIFPSGYQTTDVFNDNIDINLVLENGKVFFATLFTLENIKYLMMKDRASYFWSTDLIIVSDLKKETIRLAISEIIQQGSIASAFSEIGTIESIMPKAKSYHDIVDMSDI